jgi:hypothetical protein
MGKFNVGEKVFIKPLDKVGVIKSRDIVNLDNKRIRVEYIVKYGDGFDNWGAYTKKDLTKIVKETNDTNQYVFTATASDGYVVTMVSIVKKISMSCYTIKNLNIGYSIYNPNDVYDEKIGIKIAKHRARHTPFCRMVSAFRGEFDEETVQAITNVKLNYIVNNISKFINRKK